MKNQANPFSDPQVVARYCEGPPKAVPGFRDMQRMARLLLAEQVPDDARILVLGAGGGLELTLFAENHPRWTFEAVDPSAEMLELARQNLGPNAERVNFHHGYIDTAATGLFDGAVCLLTMHFLDQETRRQTLADVHRRLRPCAPFIMAHFSFEQSNDDERALWLSRYAAFLNDSGVDLASATKTSIALNERLHILTPQHDEALIRGAGFKNPSLFYASFTYRGWVACA
ncbi:class I SAM-dependent methyltransferase [Brucella pseudogrignonensis]|uniref:tRNA (Cmo5U34)-methyltransferase n=1 Tax=Brucella pseudogrignonensis TaxID=419475 RepID=A0ABU1M9B9_9HYPH|nr:class I SAM-dependent methyltransferase [Brucella pseudogrignonensis]MDR6432624.1 tRNA (cmo5U34)-methyltransferase [Brucella pseudogrignonensis]